MNIQAASNFMQHLADGNFETGHAPRPVKEWLETLPIPMELRRFLQWEWPLFDCMIGYVDIVASSKLQQDHDLEILLAHQFLPIGSGVSGDTFVIDFSIESCPVGFITHEEWSREENPRPFYQEAARSMETYLYRVTEKRYVPGDYYDAKAYQEFLTAEQAHNPLLPDPPFK